MKIEFSSQRREMPLFLTTNMAAVTSRANEQYILYTSEVWGSYDKLNLDKWEQDPSLQKEFTASFYKYFLNGLNKRASNVVAGNEVGQTSLKPTTGHLLYAVM